MVRYETWCQRVVFPCLRCRLLHPQDRPVAFTSLAKFTIHQALFHGEDSMKRYHRMYVIPDETITLD
jgi:hypothetical protein